MTGNLILVYAIDSSELPICNQLEYRTFNGTCNNLTNPLYGSAGIELLRKAPSDYSDGISEPSGQTRPSARIMSWQLSQILFLMMWVPVILSGSGGNF